MAFLLRPVEKLKKTNDVMMVCRWMALVSQHPLKNDHKQQQICQIRHEKNEWSTRFFELKENRVGHTFWLHLRKNKQKMKTGSTTHSWNKAIWLALSSCHVTVTCKINKLEKPGDHKAIFMPYLADLLLFMVIFEQMLWRQSCPPAYHHQWKPYLNVKNPKN